MRAIVHDPAAGLRFTDVPDPAPRPHELLLEVGAAALNFLDVARFLERHAGLVR